MSLLPYPPNWSRESSPEVLTIWERFSWHTWLRFWLVWRDEDRQMAWFITATSGFLALLLVILLFLESWPMRMVPPKVVNRPVPVRAIVKEKQPFIPDVVTLAEIDPALVEVAYPVEFAVDQAAFSWPVVETKPAYEPPVIAPVVEEKPPATPVFDPFEMFAPPKQAEPEPAPEMVEMPAFLPPERPAVQQIPELLTDLATTNFYPNPDFTEQRTFLVQDSRYLGDSLEASMVQSLWRRMIADDSRYFENPVPPSWFERQEEWLTNQAAKPTSQNEAGASTTQTSVHGNLLLTKQCPAVITERQPFSYTLTVKNNGQQAVDYVKVLEKIEDTRTVLRVEPAAANIDNQLEWIITALKPGEERVLKITCQASEVNSVLKAEAAIDVLHTVASTTQVIIPDVVVTVTLPVEVKAGENFAIQILVANNSQKTFASSDLRVQLLNGLHQRNETDLVRRIAVPAPGKTLEIPMTLTSTTEDEEGVLEVKLNLEETLTVPVKAYTVITPVKTEAAPEKNETHETSQQKPVNRLAVSKR